MSNSFANGNVTSSEIKKIAEKGGKVCVGTFYSLPAGTYTLQCDKKGHFENEKVVLMTVAGTVTNRSNNESVYFGEETKDNRKGKFLVITSEKVFDGVEPKGKVEFELAYEKANNGKEYAKFTLLTSKDATGGTNGTGTVTKAQIKVLVGLGHSKETVEALVKAGKSFAEIAAMEVVPA